MKVYRDLPNSDLLSLWVSPRHETLMAACNPKALQPETQASFPPPCRSGQKPACFGDSGLVGGLSLSIWGLGSRAQG